MEAAAGGAGRSRASTARAVDPALARTASVWPTAATCGSVKTTRGESGRRPLARRASSSPRITSAAIARLVLAHVREQRAAVDVADRVEPVGARARAARRRPRSARPARARPSRARGRRVRGRRPTRDEQLVAGQLLARRRASRSRSRRRRAARRPRVDAERQLDAALASASRDLLAGELLLARRAAASPASIIVTCAPSVRHACAISTPTTPPPSTISRRRTSSRRRRLAVRPRRRLASPGIGGSSALGPGRDDHRLARAQQLVAVHVDAPLAVEPRVAADQRRRRAPRATAAAPCRRGGGSPRRGARARRATSSSAGRPPRPRRARAAASASASAGRSSAFDGMHA